MCRDRTPHLESSPCAAARTRAAGGSTRCRTAGAAPPVRPTPALADPEGRTEGGSPAPPPGGGGRGAGGPPPPCPPGPLGPPPGTRKDPLVPPAPQRRARPDPACRHDQIRQRLPRFQLVCRGPPY